MFAHVSDFRGFRKHLQLHTGEKRHKCPHFQKALHLPEEMHISIKACDVTQYVKKRHICL